MTELKIHGFEGVTPDAAVVVVAVVVVVVDVVALVVDSFAVDGSAVVA